MDYSPKNMRKRSEDPALSGLATSTCSAFWAAGWSRLLDKKIAEYRASGSEGEFHCDPIPYRAGAAGGRCAREASESAALGPSDETACSQLREPLEAPRDGTFILGAFGWPWLVPAVWNSYDQEWVMCHMQAQTMANGLEDRWLEMEREKALALTGWLPVPPLPDGYVFRPTNAPAMARPEPPTNTER